MATKAQVAKQKRTPKFQTRKYNRVVSVDGHVVILKNLSCVGFVSALLQEKQKFLVLEKPAGRGVNQCQ